MAKISINNNEICELIKKIVEKVIENNKKNNTGFPVCSAFFDKDHNLINIEFNSRAYKKTENRETDFTNHAEYKSYIDVGNKQFDVNDTISFITIPPCEKCFDEIFKNKNDCKIFYFFDDVRKKTNKKYLKEFIKNKNITIINPNNFLDINTKYNIYYIIMSCLGGFLTQKLNNETSYRIEKISKKWVLKLRKAIKNDELLIEKIKTKEILSMIEKAKKFIQKSNFKKDFIWII